jgi:hypothetical protein
MRSAMVWPPSDVACREPTRVASFVRCHKRLDKRHPCAVDRRTLTHKQIRGTHHQPPRSETCVLIRRTRQLLLTRHDSSTITVHRSAPLMSSWGAVHQLGTKRRPEHASVVTYLTPLVCVAWERRGRCRERLLLEVVDDRIKSLCQDCRLELEISGQRAVVGRHRVHLQQANANQMCHIPHRIEDRAYGAR